MQGGKCNEGVPNRRFAAGAVEHGTMHRVLAIRQDLVHGRCTPCAVISSFIVVFKGSYPQKVRSVNILIGSHESNVGGVKASTGRLLR